MPHPATAPAEPPTVGAMLEGAAGFAGGLVTMFLPYSIMAVPALALVLVPLIVLSIPLVLVASLLALPVLAARRLRRVLQPQPA
jgi:hypothetical protein